MKESTGGELGLEFELREMILALAYKSIHPEILAACLAVAAQIPLEATRRQVKVLLFYGDLIITKGGEIRSTRAGKSHNAMKFLNDARAVVQSYKHFVLASGRHSAFFLDETALDAFPIETSLLCRALASRFRKSGIDVVIASREGSSISQGVAYYLAGMTNHDVFYTCGDPAAAVASGYDGGKFIGLVSGKRVLIVDVFLTDENFESVRKTTEVMRAIDCEVVGLGVFCSFASLPARIMAPLVTLEYFPPLETWSEGECPYCAKGIPTEVPRRRRFGLYVGDYNAIVPTL